MLSGYHCLPLAVRNTQNAIGIAVVYHLIVCIVGNLGRLNAEVRGYISNRSCFCRCIVFRSHCGQAHIAEAYLSTSGSIEAYINIVFIQSGQFITVVTVVIFVGHGLSGSCIGIA